MERAEWPRPPESKAGRVARALEWFQPGGNGALVVKPLAGDDRAQRLALVEDLLKVLETGAQRRAPDPALHTLLTAERDRLKPSVRRALPRRKSTRRSRG